MKKLFTIISVLVIGTVLSAQTVKPFKVSGFTGIDASGVYKIEVTQSSNESLTIDTEFELMKYVEVKVKDGVLYLSLDTDAMPRYLKRNTPDIKAKVGIKQLEKVRLSGASSLVAKSNFSPDKFSIGMSGASYAEIPGINSIETKIDISGASKLQFNSKGKEVLIDVSGASKLIAKLDFAKVSGEFSGASSSEVSGTSMNAEFEVSGATSLKAEAFTSANLFIDASGASKATFGKLKEVLIKASGASSIRYYGNPIVRVKEVSGASSVKQLN
jgi:hypothetical protein